MITVLSLGPGAKEYLSKESEQLLHTSCLFLRTSRHPIAEALIADGISFTALDDLYDEYEDFDELHQAIADRILKESTDQEIVYAVPDPETDQSVRILRRQNGIPVRVLPGVSYASYYLSRLPQPFAPSSSICTCSAMDCTHPVDTETDLLITELHSQALAGDIKIVLCNMYSEETEIVFFPAGLKAPSVIPLFTLDRQKKYDHTSAVYIPAVPFECKTRFTFQDLMHVMSILRSQDGCPWDQEQTHESLRPYLLEEAYEAAGAIDEEDMDHLCEELGDVLLQVAFHASIAESSGDFNHIDIASAICQKMIRRHPKVFGHASVHDDHEAWDQLKKEERGYTSVSDSLADVTHALPALTRATKVQSRAGKAGVGFQSSEEALRTAQDILSTILQSSATDTGKSLGQLLFTVIDAARTAGLDADQLLSSATDRFIDRFSEAESKCKNSGNTQNPLTLQEMNVYLRTAH